MGNVPLMPTTVPIAHVYPFGDDREHNTGSWDFWFCWCHPRVEFFPHACVIHNAHDPMFPAPPLRLY